VTDGETARLIAWSDELRRVHERLRGALRLTREALGDAVASKAAARDLLIYCHGFCVALDGHHRGEDTSLFPAIEAAHPDLQPVLKKLQQDHSMIAHLLGGLRDATEQHALPDELARHVEGVAAIMESHFRYEERELLTVLDGLELRLTPVEAFGPF
jgi:hypothetical protein